jgi:septal ring factor EnvC (AmiA/AmiB activator)
MAAACSEARRFDWAAALVVVVLATSPLYPAGEPLGTTAGGETEASAGEDARASADEFAERRQELELEMDRLRTELERFAHEEQSLLERVERLRLESRLRQQEVEGIDLERRSLERRLDRLGFQIDRLSLDLERQKALLGGRLRAIYRRGPLAPARTLTSTSTSAEWLRAVGLMEHLARRDARAIERLRADAAELESARDSQQRALAQLEREHRRAEQARSRLASALSEHGSLLEAVRNDHRTHRAAYDELNAATLELDRLIERVSRGETPADVESAWVSLGAFRGLLAWPVLGTLELPFGDVKHPRFKTITPHRGLTLVAEEGAPVSAVFEGEVVFQDWLTGYGQTVILDHHHGYLSVYAHLSQPQVEVGARVPRSGVLGQVGDSGSLEGPKLYFELRRDGLPLDPEPWLTHGPQRAAR